MRGRPPCDLCCIVSTRVICKGDAFLKDLTGEKRVLVSESQACTSLILLIIKIDVFPNCWFSLECVAQLRAEPGFPYRVSPGMAQGRKKLSFFILTFRAAFLGVYLNRKCKTVLEDFFSCS